MSDFMKIQMFPLPSHRNDPFTSYVAADRAAPASAGHRLDIYLELCKAPGTASELAERIGHLDRYQISRRLSEGRGKWRRTGETRNNPAGNPETVWEAIISKESQ